MRDCFTHRNKPCNKKKAKAQEDDKFSTAALKAEDPLEDGDAEQLKKSSGMK